MILGLQFMNTLVFLDNVIEEQFSNIGDNLRKTTKQIIKTNKTMFPLGTKMRRMLLMNIEIPQSTRLLRYHSLFNGQLPLKK